MCAKRILVLDDEPEFGAFVQRVVESLNHEVVVLTRPTEFASTYHRIQPDIVVLDIVMPDIDGLEIINWLVSVENQAKVILVSGYNPSYAKAGKMLADLKGRFPVISLTKPVSLDQLTSAIEDGAD